MAKKIHLSGVGPIEALEIPIPDEGGVVVLRGHNGAGKSVSLDAVKALLGGAGKGRPAVPVHDGYPTATAIGLGVQLLVGRRAHRSGEVEVRALDGVDPSDLVDPGIKDPEAADAARIRALCILAGAAPDPALFAALAPGLDIAELLTSEQLRASDLPTLAGRIKRALEQRARALEAEAAGLLRECQGIAATVEGVDTSAPHDEGALAAGVEAAIRTLVELEAQRDRAAKEAEAVAKARARLAQIEPVPLDSLIMIEEGQEAEYQETQERVTKLREQLLAAERQLEDDARELRRARQARTDGERAAKERGKLEKDIAACHLEGPSEEVVGAAREAVDQARAAQQAGVLVRQALDQGARAEVLRDRSRDAMIQAEQYRAGARGTEAVLTAAIAKVAPRGLRVEGGRLVVQYEARGREIPYAELSDGERWRLSLDVAIDSVGDGGLIVVRQAAWEALDGSNRKLIAEHARSRKAVVLTAAAADGDLHAEVLR